MIRRIFENYENRQLKKRLAIVTKRIKELEAQLADLQEKIVYKDKRIALKDTQIAELTAPKPVETFEPELLTGSFSSYWQLFIEPHGLVTVFNFHYNGGYEQVIVLPEVWEENEKALEASIGKEITIKATWQDDELEFIFDSIVPVNLPLLSAICATCNSVIEGVVHTRRGLDDSYTLCGACVTENED